MALGGPRLEGKGVAAAPERGGVPGCGSAPERGAQTRERSWVVLEGAGASVAQLTHAPGQALCWHVLPTGVPAARTAHGKPTSAASPR